MVKYMLIIILTALASVLVFTLGLILWSYRTPTVGLVDGKLRPCPNTPNCVCSETKNTASIAPLMYTNDSRLAWQQIKHAIINSGGTLMKEEKFYLWATYTTPWMRFVDDIEVRMDHEKQRIHLRSASRVGHSDLGKNKQRIKKISAFFVNNTAAAPRP